MLIKYGHAYDDPKSAQDEILNKEGKGWRQILSRLAIFSFLFLPTFVLLLSVLNSLVRSRPAAMSRDQIPSA